MMQLVSVLALLLVQVGPHASGTPGTISGTATVPMLDIGGRPMIEVRINGKGPYALILDTGASSSGLDPELLREVGVVAVDGGDERTVALDQLQVGDLTMRPFRGFSSGGLLSALQGPTRPRGVLSAAAFPGCLVIFDYPGKQVTIKPGTLPAADNHRVFEYHADEILPVIPVKVADHEYRIHLDTGSPGSVMLPTKYAAELPLAAPPRTVGRARTVAGEFEVQAATVQGPLAIGDFVLPGSDVRFSDLRPGPEPGIGNVGGAVLRDFVVTFDATNRRIAIARGGQP